MVDRENDEEESQIEECTICGGDIIVDSYCEEDDIVYCNDCEAEYVIRSTDPIRLKRLDDEDVDDAEDSYDEEDE
jgi:lysine biosynthesis protein LysW